MSAKAQFGSKIGLIAATVGSAVGLGNIWRFPAETQANGGAAFLLVYVLCVLVLGIPVMLGEFSVGRAGGSDAFTDFKCLAPGKRWWMIGSLGIVASYMILCFYVVVSGWTFEYLVGSVTGDLFVPVDGTADTTGMFTARMHDYVQSDLSPLLSTFAMIIVNLAILLCGVRKGIERISRILMPSLFVLLLIFCVVALSLPKASEGLEFFFKPDFSKITPGVVIDALGQSFFSLSLGMGILITYASYFPKSTKLGRTALSVSLLDLLVAVMMGVIIFPSILSFGLEGESLEGTSLVFVTLPEVFTRMEGTQLWSILFFTLLLVAALTSTISVAEVSIRFFQDRMRMSRLKASLTVMLPLFLFSSLCSLSMGSLSGVKILDMSFFSLLETIATNILLPLGAMLTCVYIGWFAPKGLLRGELTNGGTFRNRAMPIIIFVIKYIAPVFIFMILVASFC